MKRQVTSAGTSKPQKIYVVRIAQTGEILDLCKTKYEAMRCKKEYEESDKSFDIFDEGFYEIATYLLDRPHTILSD